MAKLQGPEALLRWCREILKPLGFADELDFSQQYWNDGSKLGKLSLKNLSGTLRNSTQVQT